MKELLETETGDGLVMYVPSAQRKGMALRMESMVPDVQSVVPRRNELLKSSDES